MAGPRRWRHCTHCGYIGAAGTFSSTYGANYKEDKPAMRTCPKCGRRGRTDEFPIVPQPREVS